MIEQAMLDTSIEMKNQRMNSLEAKV